MNKLIFVALAVFCVAADVTVNYGSWVTYPSVVLNVNNKADQQITNNTDFTMTAANNTLLAVGTTFYGNNINTTIRNLQIDDYNKSANDDAHYYFPVPTPPTVAVVIPTFNGLNVFAEVTAINNFNQVSLVRTYLGNATQPNVQLTTNDNATLSYALLSGWYANKTYWVLFQEKSTTDQGTYYGNLLLGGIQEDSTVAHNVTIVYKNTDNLPTIYKASGATVPGTNTAYIVFTNTSDTVWAFTFPLDGNGTASAIINYRNGDTSSTVNSLNVFATNNYAASAVYINNGIMIIRTTADLTKNITLTDVGTSSNTFQGAQPYYDNVALFWRNYNGGTYSYTYQLYDGQNFTTNGTEVTLISGVDYYLQFHTVFTQYGSAYGYWYNSTNPFQAVWLGQFFNRTHDAASLLQSAVYVCGALLAALFAF